MQREDGMLNLWKTLGLGSLAVITITLILFVTALFVKRFTHDLLLEAAVFFGLGKTDHFELRK